MIQSIVAFLISASSICVVAWDPPVITITSDRSGIQWMPSPHAPPPVAAPGRGGAPSTSLPPASVPSNIPTSPSLLVRPIEGFRALTAEELERSGLTPLGMSKSALTPLSAAKPGFQIHAASGLFANPTTSAVQRFASSVSFDRVGRAMKSTAPKWLIENAASLSGTGMYCLLCLFPETSIACGPCLSSTIQESISFAIETSFELVDQMCREGTLTKEQSKVLRQTIEAGRDSYCVWDVLKERRKGPVHQTVAILKCIIDSVVSDERIKIAVGNAVGGFDKVGELIDILQNSGKR